MERSSCMSLSIIQCLITFKQRLMYDNVISDNKCFINNIKESTLI